MDKVANNLVKNVATGELVPLSSLWSTKTIVLAFLRRWGWQLCRAWALDLSGIKPQLDAHGVGLVGVGFEELGVQKFVDGKYFDGDLYIDQELATYKALGMQRAGKMSSVKQLLFSKEMSKSVAHANALGVKDFDYKGDGFQQGGTYVLEKGGKVLFQHIQNSLASHPELNDILKSLNIESEGNASNVSKVSCNDEGACAMPTK